MGSDSSSRDEVLRALRAARVEPCPLPEVKLAGVRYADILAQFAQSVADVGGRCVIVENADADIEAELARIPEYTAAKRVLSLVSGVKKANVDWERAAEVEHSGDIDFCVLAGKLGVAENGAVWVVDDGSSRRAGWFLAEHMALIVRSGDIVHNMHEAYERIQVGGRGFAMFISGPSKTADIEQSLVIGAQGPRSCTVLVVK
ncbi:MAG TPA: LUD domain-containing protein [Polyangiaceae bacterium]|nr:LUD domain-containing protein [Polyangiaceae bacterium]